MRHSGRDIANHLRISVQRASQIRHAEWFPTNGATLDEIKAAYEANVRTKETPRRASPMPAGPPTPPPVATVAPSPASEPSESLDALTISHRAVARCWQGIINTGPGITARDADALKKILGELRQAESDYIDLAERRKELIPRDEHREIVGMLAARLVRCCDILENSISTEFAVWLADEEVRAMDADARARKVRGWVAAKCRAVRQAEADLTKGVSVDAGD